MAQHILITGGTGLIGTRLTAMLLAKGYTVMHLSRNKRNTVQTGVQTYEWDIEKGIIDDEALQKADIIIHLAGANLAEKRWSDKQKKLIYDSRVKSAQLLYNSVKRLQTPIQAFISASGISIYGTDTGGLLLAENAKQGDEFLANVCKAWEQAADVFATMPCRVVKLREGLVLSNQGGSLPLMVKPVRLGAGAAIASGQQYMSWIHIDDLCRLFIKAIEDPTMQGAYNAVSPNPVTNKVFTQKIAEVLHRPLLLPNVPAFVLRMALGEMANLVIGGNKVSAQKIQDSGFKFQFITLDAALKDLLL